MPEFDYAERSGGARSSRLDTGAAAGVAVNPLPISLPAGGGCGAATADSTGVATNCRSVARAVLSTGTDPPTADLAARRALAGTTAAFGQAASG